MDQIRIHSSHIWRGSLSPIATDNANEKMKTAVVLLALACAVMAEPIPRTKIEFGYCSDGSEEYVSDLYEMVDPDPIVVGTG